MEFQNREQFENMVKEEVQRMAIRKELEPPPSKKTKLEYLRHPIFSVLISFLLTGVLGSYLTNYFQDQEKKRLLQREAFNHIRQFSQALSRRTTESGYLGSALLRNVADKNLSERKKSYDESVKQWNTDLIKHLFTFREYAESRNKIFIERNIENDLIPILRAVDVCLTDEFDAEREKRRAKNSDQITCWIEVSDKVYPIKLGDLNNASRACGYEISNLLFSWVAVNLKSGDDDWKEKAESVQSTIADRCRFNLPDRKCEPSAIKPLHRTAAPLR